MCKKKKSFVLHVVGFPYVKKNNNNMTSALKGYFFKILVEYLVAEKFLES